MGMMGHKTPSIRHGTARHGGAATGHAVARRQMARHGRAVARGGMVRHGTACCWHGTACCWHSTAWHVRRAGQGRGDAACRAARLTHLLPDAPQRGDHQVLPGLELGALTKHLCVLALHGLRYGLERRRRRRRRDGTDLVRAHQRQRRVHACVASVPKGRVSWFVGVVVEAGERSMREQQQHTSAVAVAAAAAAASPLTYTNSSTPRHAAQCRVRKAESPGA